MSDAQLFVFGCIIATFCAVKAPSGRLVGYCDDRATYMEADGELRSFEVTPRSQRIRSAVLGEHTNKKYSETVISLEDSVRLVVQHPWRDTYRNKLRESLRATMPVPVEMMLAWFVARRRAGLVETGGVMPMKEIKRMVQRRKKAERDCFALEYLLAATNTSERQIAALVSSTGDHYTESAVGRLCDEAARFLWSAPNFARRTPQETADMDYIFQQRWLAAVGELAKYEADPAKVKNGVVEFGIGVVRPDLPHTLTEARLIDSIEGKPAPGLGSSLGAAAAGDCWLPVDGDFQTRNVPAMRTGGYKDSDEGAEE